MGGKSILNLSPSMVYGFWHSDPVAKNNDIQFVFAPASYKLENTVYWPTTPGSQLPLGNTDQIAKAGCDYGRQTHSKSQ